MDEQWLRCLECKTNLALVTVRNGRTALPITIFGHTIWIDRAEIPCPACGSVRRFVSVPVAGNASSTQKLCHSTS